MGEFDIPLEEIFADGETQVQVRHIHGFLLGCALKLILYSYSPDGTH